MNLQNFSEDAGLNELREQMGAKRIPWESEVDWKLININAMLVPTGLVISPDKIKPAKDGTLDYEGQKLVVYIRDQTVPSHSSPSQLCKFHVADCITLEEMRKKGTFKKYVRTTRTDGMFDVNFIEGGKLIEACVERNLYVCMNCLGKLDYKKYNSFGSLEQNKIKESFDLKEFFETYGSPIMIEPTHTDITAPVNEYPPDWTSSSRCYREKVGWKCEKCYIDFGEEKRFLHVHHINGSKYESTVENLRALCIGCHAEQFQHEQIKSKPEYDEFCKWRDSLNPIPC